MEHMPLSKLTTEQLLEKKMSKKKQNQFHGHKIDGEFKQWAPKQEIASDNYNAKSRQAQNLQGTYQKSYDSMPAEPATLANKVPATIERKDTKTLKQEQLGSRDFETGASSLAQYSSAPA